MRNLSLRTSRPFTLLVVAVLVGLVLPYSAFQSQPVYAQCDNPVTIVTWDGPTPDQPDWEKALIEQEIAIFKETHPCITLDQSTALVGSDYRQAYDRNLIAGTEPTVVNMFPYVDIPSRIKDGSIADLSEFVDNWDLAKEGMVFTGFDQAIKDAEGHTYAVPESAYTQGLVYNVRLVEEAGLDPAKPPKTWDEFVEWGQKLTDPAKPQFGFGLIGMAWNAWPFTNFVWLAGGQMFEPNDDGTWKVAFNSDDGVEALMFWHDMIWVYKMTQTDVLMDYDALQQEFQQERIAMLWGGLGSASLAAARFGTPIENFAFAPMPVAEGGRSANLTGGKVWTVSPNATPEQRAAAWEYIQFWTYDSDHLDRWYKVYDEHQGLAPDTPAFLGIDKMSYASSFPDFWGPALLEVARVAEPEPWVPNWNDIKNMLVDPIQSIILNENATPEDARQALDDVAKAIYERFPDGFHE